ncbi:MAG: tetratricopeptide repeat protein, partial [Treponema sp.]|nr:tetratricopeptide repeat protein [Treponema sp.]
MNPANHLDTVYFIKLPDDYRFANSQFKLDPTVPIPVQKKDGDDSETMNISELSQEQILAGILTVLAYDKSNENIPYYRQMIEKIRPKIKVELQEAAILKTRNEEWELAEEMWTALHGLDPENKNIILNMALFYDQRADSYRKNSLHEDADAYDAFALTYYKDAMDSDPEIPDAFFNVGYYYLKKRNFSEAKWAFESFLALTTDASEEELGPNGNEKRETAQDMLNKISSRNLEDEHYHNAYELISSGQEEKGINEIRRFIQENPAVWNAWFLLGWGLRRLERFSDAKQAFEKARECEGGDENADTLNELAICQMETGDFNGAKESLVDALNMDPDNTKIISNL